MKMYVGYLNWRSYDEVSHAIGGSLNYLIYGENKKFSFREYDQKDSWTGIKSIEKAVQEMYGDKKRLNYVKYKDDWRLSVSVIETRKENKKFLLKIKKTLKNVCEVESLEILIK